MAIYHFSAQVIGRAKGRSALAAAAYRSAARLEDERLGRAFDYTNKANVVHSEILAPEGAPRRWQSRETLWNEVELLEKRKDAQLAREIEFSIPREMTQEQGIALARDYVQQEFVGRGMVADLNVHWDMEPDVSHRPHAHVMLSMREIKDDGFGHKARDWNGRELLGQWRESWADLANQRLTELDIDARIDHRSLEAQGIDLEPQHKIGAAGMRREERGEDAERADDHRRIARENGEKIIQEPELALGAITRQQSTFTEHDLAGFIHRHSDDKEQFDRALGAVRGSPELLAIGRDGHGQARFTARAMLETEQRLELWAERLGARSGHRVSAGTVTQEIAVAETRGLVLGTEQRDALEHITQGEDLSLVVGYAGTGKSAMLGVAREVWEGEGYTVRGAALSGIAAESLEAGSGIGSRTVASLEHGWEQGRELLSHRDILVIDEAGMIGSRQMERVLGQAERAGAKVVLVGDAEQLQAIEAGAAFRALNERHGAAEITEIRRQTEDWQRLATRELATGRTAAALERYEAAGMVHSHQSLEDACSALVEGWDAARHADPEASQVMLAHTRSDVSALNQLARQRMREAGELGGDERVQTERGDRLFARGDRVMFLRNERSLGVKNGTLGTVQEIDAGRLAVRLDDRRKVRFEFKDYAHIDHGYASTIHKSQGVTVDHGHVLATKGLDRHGAYVAMSRHRETLSVHYGADEFRSREQLVSALSRDRPKDTTLDYQRPFAERRGIVSEIEVSIEAQRPRRGMFHGLRLPSVRPERLVELKLDARAQERSPTADRSSTHALTAAIRDYAGAVADIEGMWKRGQEMLPDQEIELRRAGKALLEINRDAAVDLRSTLVGNPGLALEAATPQGLGKVLREMTREAEARRDPEVRADRFISMWKDLGAKRDELGSYRHRSAKTEIEGRMKSMAGELHQDPQLESLLRTRSRELGVVMGSHDLGRELVRSLGLGRGMEL